MTTSTSTLPDSHDSDLISSPLETLHNGLTFQRIFNNRALAFYAENTTRGLVDAWAAKITEVVKTSHDRTHPLFVLNDFSGKDCAVTPYNQQKNRELLQMFPEMRPVTAIVYKQNLTFQLSRIFIRMMPRSNVSVYLTADRADGMAWLKQQIDGYWSTHA